MYIAGACTGACMQFLHFLAKVEVHRALEFVSAAKLSGRRFYVIRYEN